MKKIIFCSGLILVLGVFGFGQKEKRSPDVDPGSRSLETDAFINSGTRIEGQLQSTLDVKRSRVGDKVVLKTTKAITQNGQTVVPKGSRLIGRITDVRQKTRSNGASRLAMVFDRIEGNELSAPISASIVSISNVAANAGIDGTASSDVFASSGSSARTSSSTSGGGLLGGVTNTVGGITNAAGGVLDSTTRTAGNVTRPVGNAVGSSTETVTRTVNGIQISNSVSGSAQSGTTLSSADRNIRLEKGATLGLLLNSSVRPQ